MIFIYNYIKIIRKYECYNKKFVSTLDIMLYTSIYFCRKIKKVQSIPLF